MHGGDRSDSRGCNAGSWGSADPPVWAQGCLASKAAAATRMAVAGRRAGSSRGPRGVRRLRGAPWAAGFGDRGARKMAIPPVRGNARVANNKPHEKGGSPDAERVAIRNPGAIRATDGGDQCDRQPRAEERPAGRLRPGRGGAGVTVFQARNDYGHGCPWTCSYARRTSPTICRSTRTGSTAWRARSGSPTPSSTPCTTPTTRSAFRPRRGEGVHAAGPPADLRPGARACLSAQGVGGACDYLADRERYGRNDAAPRRERKSSSSTLE